MNADASTTSVDEVLLAMDIVDTLRHERTAIEMELADDERREALTARLRVIYRSQGIEVSDEDLTKGVKALDERRFQHRPIPPGSRRTMATVYVRRWKYGIRSAVAAASIGIVVGLTGVIFSLVERQAAEQEAKIRAELTETLPLRLEEATRNALAAVGADDGDAGRRTIDDLRRRIASLSNHARQAIAQGRRDEASSRIASIEGIGAKARTRRELGDLVADMRDRIAEVRRLITSEDAEEALTSVEDRVTVITRSGNADAARTASIDLDRLVSAISIPLAIRIVDRPGERSGVWRQRDGDPSTKVHYLVVEALAPDGKTVSRHIRSAETGLEREVTTWAIRVPENVYDRVAKDKSTDGIIGNRDVGIKPRGAIAIEWSIPTTGDSITNW